MDDEVRVVTGHQHDISILEQLLEFNAYASSRIDEADVNDQGSFRLSPARHVLD